MGIGGGIIGGIIGSCIAPGWGTAVGVAIAHGLEKHSAAPKLEESQLSKLR